MSERLITLQEVRESLPVKNDFLLLDRVQMLDENHYIALKAVSITELHFIGHFPNHPIMPGVLQVEAIAQLAELAVWKRLDPERKGDLYIKQISKVKFRKPNNPGDRILLDVKVTGITDTEAQITATVTNNSGLACQAQLVMAVRPKMLPPPIPTEFNIYDKSENSVMDVNQIMSHIPHRFPFLFVDYVAKIEGSHITGVKNATQADLAFRVYNDGYSVLSGSVHPEIVSQAGCIYMLSNPASQGKIAYFMGIEKADFMENAAVFPGDQMRLEMDIPDNTKKFGRGEGSMYVGDTLISTTSMMFAIVDP